MDILYIVGRQLSQWQDNELRYSLRSIAKFGRNVGRVFVAGYIPPFVNPDTVQCVRVRDIGQVKHNNICNAIDVAVKTTDIGKDDVGEFLYSSDDHFYIRETDFSQYPIYWRGVSLPEKGDTEYHTTLASTRKLLSWCGLPTYHMAWHGNTHFNAELWKEERFQFILRNAYTMPEGCEPTCLMLNYWSSMSPGSVRSRMIERDDYKSHGEQVFQIPHREVVSASDNIAKSALADFLRAEFRKPCKYER